MASWALVSGLCLCAVLALCYVLVLRHLSFDQVMTSKDEPGTLTRTEQAKQLLTQYGSAYLITSISFAIVSFALCYAAITAGEPSRAAMQMW